jgi:hypothetical protein
MTYTIVSVPQNVSYMELAEWTFGVSDVLKKLREFG